MVVIFAVNVDTTCNSSMVVNSVIWNTVQGTVDAWDAKDANILGLSIIWRNVKLIVEWIGIVAILKSVELITDRIVSLLYNYSIFVFVNDGW